MLMNNENEVTTKKDHSTRLQQEVGQKDDAWCSGAVALEKQ
jgi:hypothetical protein